MLHECKGRGKFVMISLKKFPEPFLVVIASLDEGYESQSIRIIKLFLRL